MAELEQKGCISPKDMRETEVFWNQIMMEHAQFIRGLLDPTENDLLARYAPSSCLFWQIMCSGKPIIIFGFWRHRYVGRDNVWNFVSIVRKIRHAALG